MYHEKAERLWFYSHDVTTTNRSGATDQLREREDALQCKNGVKMKSVREADTAIPKNICFWISMILGLSVVLNQKLPTL